MKYATTERFIMKESTRIICIMELLSYNVGIRNIEAVLQSVFKLLNINYDRLPKHTTINELLIESRSLSHAQLREILTNTSDNTLHSDGTTKFGHKYQSYQVTTEEGSLSQVYNYWRSERSE